MPDPTTPLKVGLVVGEAGRDGVWCGVRDYADRLATSLSEAGLDARVFAPPTWRIRGGLRFLRSLPTERLDIVHLQYPSIGHRASLLPHLLGMAGVARRSVVTLHEHAALPRLQRLANLLFRLSASQVVFTNLDEAKAFRAAPGSPVIPIGSNVPTMPGLPGRGERVVYFGQVRPDKGVDGFLALARLCVTEAESFRFTLVGSAPAKWRTYAQSLRDGSPDNVTWSENVPAPDVARLLANSLAAYLPFPDGAGPRRGSLVAALASGLPVVAPVGRSTTPDLLAAIRPADGPVSALAHLRALRAEPDLADRQGAAGRAVARRFDWQAIGAEHVALYRRLLGHRAPIRTPASGRLLDDRPEGALP